MTDLTFYTNPMSRGRIVRWMLEEVGESYETELLDYPDGMKTPAYLAINPMGKVPAIRHGEAVVTESSAICAYLADAFPAAGLAPAPAERADYYRWFFFTAGPIDQAMTNQMLGVAPTAEQSRSAGYGSLDAVLDTVEQTLTGREYVTGDRFSAADLYLGSQLAFGMQFSLLPERPVFAAFVERLHQRPAFIRATAIDDALLPPPADE